MQATRTYLSRRKKDARTLRQGRHALVMIDGREVAALLTLSCVGWFALSHRWTNAETIQWSVGLSLLTIMTLLLGVYFQGRREPGHIWTLLFWFRVSCAVYYGFGGIVPFIANDVTDIYLRSVYNYTPLDVLKVNVICLFGITCTMAGGYFKELVSRPSRKRTGPMRRPISLSQGQVAAIFLVAGGAIRYGLQMPLAFGLLDITLPGGILFFGNAYLAGLFFALVIGLRKGGMSLLFAILLFVIDLTVFGLLSFAKLEILRTLMFGFLALIYTRFSVPRVIAAAIVMFAIFSASQPFVHYGRMEALLITGNTGSATLQQRLKITQAYLGGDGVHNAGWNRDLQPFLRLSYVNVGAFVINQYDRGSPGTSLRYALVSMVPRVIWPDKPRIGELGSELYELIRGRDGAAVSAGYFAEVYWNFGPWGMVLIFLPVGVLFSFISNYSLNVIRSDSWHRFPAVLVGVQMGIRTDGHFAGDVTGAAAIFFILAIIFSLPSNSPQKSSGSVRLLPRRPDLLRRGAD